jgi:hypothetical protein
VFVVCSIDTHHGAFCRNLQAQLAATKGRLTGSAILENRQVFETPPTLAELRYFLLVICDELKTYKLWPVSRRCSILVHVLTR